MRLSVHAVGRLKAGPERALADRYCERLNSLGRSIAIGPIAIKELAEARAANAKQRKIDEATRLLKGIKADTVVIALDECGDSLTTKAFSKWLEKLRDDGTSELAFLIGGADGHGQEAKARAKKVISLSKMTLPHGLARILLLEQIYRAATLISGHPYHRS